jgi:hypothetical protein
MDGKCSSVSVKPVCCADFATKGGEKPWGANDITTVHVVQGCHLDVVRDLSHDSLVHCIVFRVDCAVADALCGLSFCHI